MASSMHTLLVCFISSVQHRDHATLRWQDVQQRNDDFTGRKSEDGRKLNR